MILLFLRITHRRETWSVFDLMFGAFGHTRSHLIFDEVVRLGRFFHIGSSFYRIFPPLYAIPPSISSLFNPFFCLLLIMGIHVDAANAGRNAFRPYPYEFAEISHSCNPRENPDDLVYTPASEGSSIAPMHLGANINNQIDFVLSKACEYTKLAGYLASISGCPRRLYSTSPFPFPISGLAIFWGETTSDNAKTAYRLELVVMLPYVADAHMDDPFNLASRSFVWDKVRCFASSSILTVPTALRLGSFATGIAMAAYHGSNMAVLDAWSLTGVSEWRFAAWATAIATGEIFFFSSILPTVPFSSLFLGTASTLC